MNKKKIYFAGPLFNSAELAFNKKLTSMLRSLGFDVFLPQESSSEDPINWNDAEKNPARIIFERDEEAILCSDILIFVLDGRVPDEGACVELGMAYMHKKLVKPECIIVGLKTDSRIAFASSPLNVMVQFPLDYLATTEEKLIDYLRQVAQESC